MNRTQIINEFIKRFNYTSYLEIGVKITQDNFDHIKCVMKTGVDPCVGTDKYTNPHKGYQMTSDVYFQTLAEDIKFDLIFIDGLHTHEQVNKDIQNSLKHLTENGTIVLHDCSPRDKDFEVRHRCGTVWRAFYEARKTYDIDAYVVDTDLGCGVMRKGGTKLVDTLNSSTLDFTFLDSNRVEVLNLISVDDFKQKLLA